MIAQSRMLASPRAGARPTAARTGGRLVLRRLRRSPAATLGGTLVALFVAIGLVATVYTPYDPVAQNLVDSLQGPSRQHWFGTDEFGRDLLSRIMTGATTTLTIAALGVAIGLSLGTALGVIAGFLGGWVDVLVMRLVDIQLAIPGIILAIVIISIAGVGVPPLILAVGIFSVPGFARVARAGVLSTKALEFVEAARASGASSPRVVAFHILPNCVAPLIVQASLRTATAILVASSLSFLGLGAQPPSPEWGAMLNASRDYLQSNPHVAFFPGLAVALAVLGFNLFGDGLRDALDTRLRL